MKEAIATAASNIMSTSSLHRRKQQKQSLSSKTTIEMANASMPEVKVKRTNWVTMLHQLGNDKDQLGKVKTLLCLLLLVLALLAFYFLSDNQIVDIENDIENDIEIDNGLSKIQIWNAAPPKGTALYESFMIDSTIISLISTIRRLAKGKVHLERTGEKKPKLYLHVGSPKHGTTSFQCALARIQVSWHSIPSI
jgi:hypothetical protein